MKKLSVVLAGIWLMAGMLVPTWAQVPSVIDFDQAELDPTVQPAGWEITKGNDWWNPDNYDFQVATYGKGEGAGKTVSGVAKAPGLKSKILVSGVSYVSREDETDPPATKALKVHAITPVLDKGDVTKVEATFNIGFYTYSSSQANLPSAIRPGDGDSVVFYWTDGETDGNWKRLAKVDKSTAWGNDGFASVTVPAVTPAAKFRYKIEYHHLAEDGSQRAVFFAVQNIELEESLPCKYPYDIAVAGDKLDENSALLTWEDGNTNVGAFAQSFIVTYRPQDAGAWDTVKPDPVDTEFLFEDLTPATTYNVRIQAVCAGENGLSLVRPASFTTLDTIPYTLDFTRMSAIPEGVRNCRASLDAEPVPISPEAGTAGWVVGTTPSGEGNIRLPLATDANTWLVFPVLSARQDATVDIDLELFNYGLGEGNVWSRPEPKQPDTLWVFVSTDGSFGRNSRQVAGFVALDGLLFDTVSENGVTKAEYDKRTLGFDVENGKKYTFAIYVPGRGADPNALLPSSNMLGIRTLGMKYGKIIYPAVTNLHTLNLAKTSVSIQWKSNADSCVLVYKPRSAQDYDTVVTKTNRVDLTGLAPGVQYEYRVYGLYGGFPGRVSDVRYFTTIAECAVPTNFDIVETFWDGARITGHSANPRLIHIKSDGPNTEYYVNTVMAWSGTRDTLRLRGLYVSGVGYPYAVRLRSVCNPGDSSVWTETKTFLTADYPEIGMPTNLTSSFNASDRTARLSWTPGKNNDFTDIYYKKAGTRKYDTVSMLNDPAMTTATYVLRNLERDVVYKWRLCAGYDSYLMGKVTPEQDLNTAVANEDAEYAKSLRIKMENRQIVIENPDNRYIKVINVYDVSGRLVKAYPVNERGNVFVNADLKQGMVLVEVVGSTGERAILKTIVM